MTAKQADPEISFGIPVRNGARFLERAISSCLEQEVENLELVIADNGSTDETPEICREWARKDQRVRYHRGRPVSAWRNYNRVFDLSTGEFFKWVAHDDWMSPRFARAALEDLRTHPDAALTTSPLCYIGDNGENKGTRPRPTEDVVGAAAPDVRIRLRTVIRGFRDVSASAFGLMRTSALLQTGQIRNVPEPDRVLIGELALLGPIRFLTEPLLFRYLGDEHLGRDTWIWLDPENVGRPKLATPRFLVHHLAAIRRSGFATSEKLALASELVTGAAIARSRYKFRRWLPTQRQRTR